MTEQMDLTFYDGDRVARAAVSGWPVGTCAAAVAVRHERGRRLGAALGALEERDHATSGSAAGFSLRHHTLSDFRVEHGRQADTLLTGMLATLMASKPVTLQSGGAGWDAGACERRSASFRRASTLRERCLVAGSSKWRRCAASWNSDLCGVESTRQKAARERAARQRQEVAVERAIAELPLMQAAHERTQRQRARWRASRKGKAADEDAKKSEREREREREPESQHHRPRGARDEGGRRRLPSCVTICSLRPTRTRV